MTRPLLSPFPSKQTITSLRSLQNFFRLISESLLTRHCEQWTSEEAFWGRLVAVLALCHSICEMPRLKRYKQLSIRLRVTVLTLAALWTLPLSRAQQPQTQLANATVLIIRHAEKPTSGSSLTPEGFARAQKYAHFFLPFHVDGTAITLNALYAGADSANSVRPRLTLEPLSQTSGLPINKQFPTTDPEALAHALIASPHGDHVLIAWRHSKIPALLKALNADPALLLPDGNWPDSVYDWVILLHYDAQGHLETQKLIHEPNPLP